ncbi:MAG: hypothetical protein LBJ44_03980 [Propionibacteriaceae bacterium]|nr:hypothetical protein [Propionibacteriaceae bacterium]
MSWTPDGATERTVADLIERHDLKLRVLAVEEEDDPDFGPLVRIVYTAPQRVDFRALVIDLAKALRRRIDMRQVGERETAQQLGGLGLCGRQLCCATFLGRLEPVPVALARRLSEWTDPDRLTGSCGRLMCCLRFEPDPPDPPPDRSGPSPLADPAGPPRQTDRSSPPQRVDQADRPARRAPSGGVASLGSARPARPCCQGRCRQPRPLDTVTPEPS